MQDYWDAVKNPASAISRHKKHDLHSSMKLLIASAFFFSLGISIFISKIALQAGSFATELFIGSLLTLFSLAVLAALGFGLIHELAASVMGGRGGYYESVTAISFFLAAPSLGILAASLLLFVPYIAAIGAFIVALTFATGLASFYRATKELARVDTITSYIVVSVVMLSFFVFAYSAFLLNISLLGG